MTVQLIVLRGVPEDEAEEIRCLLREAHIDYYETPEGNWGVSMPAIWLRDEMQLDTARKLIEDYQERRAEEAREAYRRKAGEGKLEGFLDRLRHEPLRIVIYLAIIAAVLYFSTMPFVSLTDP